jgi:uncharacterized membrane protein
LFLLINIFIAIRQGIWLDEIYTLKTTNQNLRQVFFSAVEMEAQAPFYFILLSFWRLIDSSFLWARLFSVLMASASIVAAFYLFQLFFNQQKTFLFCILYTLNPFTFWIAQEIRLYSFAVLLLIIQFYFFFKYYYFSQQTKKKYFRLIFSFLCVVSVYTHYYLAFPILANFIVLLLFRKYNKSWLYLADVTLAVLSLFFLVPFLSAQFSFHDVSTISSYSFFGAIGELIIRIDHFLTSSVSFPKAILFLRIPFLVFFYSLFVFFAVFMRQRNKCYSGTKVIFSYLLFLFLVTFLLFFIIDANNILLFRHTFYLFPIVLLSFYFILNMLKRRALVIISVILICCHCLELVKLNYKNSKSDDLISIAQIIEKSKRSKQKVIFYCNIYGEIFNELHSGNSEVSFLPKKFDFKKRIDYKEYVINNEKEIEAYISFNNIHDTIWLVVDNDEIKPFGVDYNYSLVNNYFTNEHIILEDTVIEQFRLRKVLIKGKIN